MKASSIRPPAKFWTVPLIAMPMAMPPAARSAAIDVVLMPSVPIMNMIRRIQRMAVTRLCMKEVSVASAPRRVNTRAMNFLDLRMSQAPTTYSTSAKTSLMPNLMKEVTISSISSLGGVFRRISAISAPLVCNESVEKRWAIFSASGVTVCRILWKSISYRL